MLDTVAADKTHRGHAIIEQVHADLKNSALAHLPSGKFTANAAWLVLAVIAFNLTRAAGTLAAADLAKATTATVRRKLITSRPDRDLRPTGHPAPTPSLALAERVDPTVRPRRGPTAARHVLTTQPTAARPRNPVEHPDSEVRPSPTHAPEQNPQPCRRQPARPPRRWIRG